MYARHLQPGDWVVGDELPGGRLARDQVKEVHVVEGRNVSPRVELYFKFAGRVQVPIGHWYETVERWEPPS